MNREDLTPIVIRCQQNDREAFNELLAAIERDVYVQCFFYLRHEENARDAQQEVLLKVFRKIDSLREPAAFRKWLNMTVANQCRSILGRRVEDQIPEDEEGKSLLDSYETQDEELLPDKSLDREETRRMIRELVDALPESQNYCVVGHYFSGIPVKELAQTLQVSENTVKSRLYYARKSIEAGIRDYEKQGVKLYSASPVLLLAIFFRRQEEALTPPVLDGEALLERALGPAGGRGAGKGPAPSSAAAGKTAGAGLAAKAAAGILAAAVAVGGVALLSQRQETNPSDLPSGAAQEQTLPEDSDYKGELLRLLEESPWASYARLFDFDGDGISESLFLAGADGTYSMLDWQAWQRPPEMCSFRHTDETVRPEESLSYTFMRNARDGMIYLNTEKHTSSTVYSGEGNAIADPETTLAQGPVLMSCASPVWPMEEAYEGGAGEEHIVYEDPRDYRSAASGAEYETYLKEFEPIGSVDFEDGAYTPDAVRKEIEGLP